MAASAILYVEDEETDVLLVQLALKKAQISNPLKIVENGDEAVAYLSGKGRYGQRRLKVTDDDYQFSGGLG